MTFKDSNNKGKMIPNMSFSDLNRISAGTGIVGDIKSEADFRIDGKMEGTLKTTGRVVIGETGIINGILECSNAEIFGKMKGTLTINELLSVRETGNVEGDVTTSKLSLEYGAVFNVTCKMATATQQQTKYGQSNSVAPQGGTPTSKNAMSKEGSLSA